MMTGGFGNKRNLEDDESEWEDKSRQGDRSHVCARSYEFASSHHNTQDTLSGCPQADA
jgi:hypothetical protein